jgi:hypothetical protein
MYGLTIFGRKITIFCPNMVKIVISDGGCTMYEVRCGAAALVTVNTGSRLGSVGSIGASTTHTVTL